RRRAARHAAPAIPVSQLSAATLFPETQRRFHAASWLFPLPVATRTRPYTKKPELVRYVLGADRQGSSSLLQPSFRSRAYKHRRKAISRSTERNGKPES